MEKDGTKTGAPGWAEPVLRYSPLRVLGFRVEGCPPFGVSSFFWGEEWIVVCLGPGGDGL